MKSAEALYDTICYKCDASDMYSWKVERYNEYDNVVIVMIGILLGHMYTAL